MFLQLSPNPAPQASSYDPSLHSHQVGSATSAEQQQQQRSWSLDDRYLSGRDRGGLPAPPRVLPIKDLLVPPPPLDKKSQEQLDEFEEVILRMATMTRGSCGAQPQANGETPVPTHEETSPLSSDKNYDNFLYPQGGFDPSMTYASDRYHLPQDVRGGGVGRVSTQVSMRCAPYPATVSSPSSLEVSQSNARRGSTDHGGSRAAPQVKIQLSAPWDPPQHVTGLPPLAPPQSAKMLNSTSRTQLKQQLMRQQLQQQEARERELASRINIHQQQSSQQQQLQQQSLSNQQQYLQQQHQQQQYREQQIHQQEFLRQQQLQQQQQQTEKNHQMGPDHYSQHQHHQPQSDQQQGCISQQNQDLPMDQGFQTAPVPMVVQEPIDIPSSGCLIPPSQLPQVQSRLENPTLYHVVQSRKRQQMRQMQNDLGQVTDQGDFNSDQGTPAIPISCSDGTQRGTTTTQWPYSDPGRRMAINNGAGPGPVSQQAPSVPTSTSVTARGIRGYSAGRGPVGPRSGGSTPSSRFLSPPMNNTGASFVSSGVSSAATSLTSDASEVDDVIEEILCLEEGLESGNKLKKCDSQTILPQSQGDGVPGAICDLLELNGFMEDKTSVSCPSDVPKVKTEPQSNSDPQVVAFMKDRQKKDNHNMIERRRRFNINDRIRDLSQLLPKMNEPYHEIVRDIRHNKGQILRASVDYIRRLKSDLEVSKAKEDKMRAVEQQNRRLVLRVQELETLMRLNGISVEETKIDSNLLLPSITQSDVMSPTSTTLSPTTSPFTPTPTTSPFTPLPNHTTTSPPLNAVTVAGNFTATTATTCSSGSDLTDFNLCDDASITSADPSTLLSDLGVVDPHDAKKVKCQSAHLPDLLLEDLLMNDFSDGNLGLNLMDDDSFAFTGDPMFSSPQVSSPNSSRHSFEDALTPDSMDIVS